jgi:hypothetical protein
VRVLSFLCGLSYEIKRGLRGSCCVIYCHSKSLKYVVFRKTTLMLKNTSIRSDVENTDPDVKTRFVIQDTRLCNLLYINIDLCRWYTKNLTHSDTLGGTGSDTYVERLGESV